MAKYFPDNILKHGMNGTAPRGALMNGIAKVIRARQHEGSTLYHWWNINASTGTTVLQIARTNFLEGGGRRQRGSAYLVTSGGSPVGDPGITIDGNLNTFPQTDDSTTVLGLEDDDDDNVTGELDQTTIGTDGVYGHAGCLYNDAIPDIDPVDTIDSSKFEAGRDVLATQTGSLGSMDRMRDRFDHVWRMRRLVFPWSCTQDKYVEFGVSSQDWRYIFDQTIGTGGTAPAADGPAITIPAYASGIANFGIVRIYVSVYAAMSGATDDGLMGIANKDANGSMQAFQAMQNPVTITGTTFAWYPSIGAFDPATHMYFDSPTGVAFDRACIGAKADGATDKVRIRGLALFMYPSLA